MKSNKSKSEKVWLSTVPTIADASLFTTDLEWYYRLGLYFLLAVCASFAVNLIFENSK